MAKIKALHLCTTSLEPPYFANLNQGLAERGVSLVIGSINEQRPPSWLAEIPDARYFCLNAPSRLKYSYAIPRLARLLRREHVDIIQTHLFDAGLVGLLAARLARTPVSVVARHHLDEPQLLGARTHVEMDRWMSRVADSVVVPSRAVKDYMRVQERHTGNNVEVIPYGFDFSSLDATDDDRRRVRAEFGLESSFVIGCVGRFFKNKGHLYLLRALKELVDVPRIHLLLLGSGDKPMIETMIGELGLQDSVTFAGYRSDVAACMKAMDLLVHPSLSESFGQVIVEAMNVGTAVVATSVGGVPEIISDGETGRLVPAADAGAIAGTVRELFRDQAMRERLGRAGQRSVREAFTVDRMVASHADLYHFLLKRSSASSNNHVGS